MQVLYGCRLDGRGGATAQTAEQLTEWSPGDGLVWGHLDATQSGLEDSLRQELGLPETAASTLAANETRPRALLDGNGLVVVLRGVNMNPGEDPEDMVSVRLWIEPERVISSRREKLISARELYEDLLKGDGPRTSGGLLVSLVNRIADRIGAFVNRIDEELESVEDSMGNLPHREFRRRISELRRQVAGVRRFLAPQRDALDRLVRLESPVLSNSEAQLLREESDRMTRYFEDLDLARERAVVLQEEHLAELAQHQNTRMYILSIVAAIFLPLSFFTGLLGMNVGGLPGINSPNGFLIAVLTMAGASLMVAAILRLKKWF